MDDSARGIATAALTLQSNLLNALSAKLYSQELKRSISWIAACEARPANQMEAADIARICLEGLREGLVELTAHT